jgi:hypothetical protein
MAAMKRNQSRFLGFIAPELDIANISATPYIGYYRVKLNRKHKTFAAMLMLALSCAGCGGLSASHSVSPLSFFLPGLIKADPKPPSTNTVCQPEAVKQVAFVQ